MERDAARVLIVAASGRALLLRVEPGSKPPFWVTPGGGIDPGETPEEAANRELSEEVGREDLALGRILWHRPVDFWWDGKHMHQAETFFLAEVETEFEPVVLHAGQEPITGSRWLSVEELRVLSETVYPEDLADRLESLLSQR